MFDNDYLSYKDGYVGSDEYWLGYSDAQNSKANEFYSDEYIQGYFDWCLWEYCEHFSESGFGQAYCNLPYDNPYKGLAGQCFEDGYSSGMWKKEGFGNEANS